MTLTSATSTTQAVVNHHLERFAALDLQGVVADYAPDAVMIVPTGVLRGVHEITPLFQNLFAEFAKPGATFDLQQQVIEGDVAYIWWVAETPDNTYELGTDTFFVRHGKIAVQTFAFKATPRALRPRSQRRTDTQASIHVRREALTIRVEVRDLPPLILSQRGGEAGGSLIREAPGRAGAAPTKPGRVSTARWRGSGEHDGVEYARNQRHYVP